MMKTALIVAGGLGTRMGGETPKQFLLLKDKPVLMKTMEAFYAFSKDLSIILVMHPDTIDHWKSLCYQYNFTISHEIVSGGRERFHSVQNGLNKVDENGFVAIHDGVRPLVTPQLIEKSFRFAEQFGAAVPVMPLNETIRELKEGKSRIIDRSNLFSIQTPQTFKSSLVKKAYQQSYQKEFTDDAAVVQAMGEKVHFFPGDPGNLKITRGVDLELAGKLVEI